MGRWTAIGPSLAGCHEIAIEVAAEFNRLGGEDIQVWDTAYIIDSKTDEATEYAKNALSLELVERQDED